jgi:hypothetical protein
MSLWKVTFQLYKGKFVCKPITLTALFKARNIFACSNTGIVGSNPTRGMNMCMRLFCMFLLFSLSSGWRYVDPQSKSPTSSLQDS